jgi:lactoylglutathione lyase
MISHVTIMTAKFDETIDFYDALMAMPVVNMVERPDIKIAFLGKDETKLEVIEKMDSPPINAQGLTIGFAVDNLDEKLAFLQERGIHHGSVISPYPSLRYVFFKDLNGCAIQLIEGME